MTAAARAQLDGFTIASDLVLKSDITGKKLGFLGTTGSGKTYAAMKLAEEMLAARHQIVAIDPVGVWWGLRLGRDGKKRGFDIPVFGGLHGDLPLEPGAGELVADIIVDRNISAVIDISQMDSDAEAGRFAAAFARRLFARRKAAPAATFLFLEECQEFVPQNPMGEEAKTLHAFARLLKIGRNFGLGGAMISQRPQEISKKTLNLSECIFAFQMNGKSEREAMKAWLRSAGAEDVDMNLLPTLEVGHAHVWSPRWLKVSREVHIARRKTFDSSSTPEFESGERVEVKPLKPSDLEALSAEMAETIERSKADDPAWLKKQLKTARTELDFQHQEKQRLVADFDRQLAAAKAQEDPDAIAAAFEDGKREGLRMFRPQLSRAKDLADQAEEAIAAGRALLTRLRGVIDVEPETIAKSETPPRTPQLGVNQTNSRQFPAAPPPPAPRPTGTSSEPANLPPGERNILVASAQYAGGVERKTLTVLTGYKRSSRDAYIQRLRSAGFVEVQGQQVTATPEGIAVLGTDYDPLPTGALLRERVERELPEGEWRILSILLHHQGAPVHRNDLEEAGYKRSSRDAYIQRLKARQLVIVEPGGMLRAAEELF